MEKKAFFEKIHQELADKHQTSPRIIKFVRNYGMSKFKLIPLQTHVEEKISIVQTAIENQKRAIEKRSKPQKHHSKEYIEERNRSTQEQIDLAMNKKAFLLDVYTFLHRLGDEQFRDITKPIRYKKP